MKKRTRFLIVLIVIAGCLAFLYPTFRWYALTPDWEKELASYSRKDIDVYAKEKAGIIVDALKGIVEPVLAMDISAEEKRNKLEEIPLIETLNEKALKENPDAFNEEKPFEFLKDIAKDKMKLLGQKYNGNLSVASFFSLFPGSLSKSIKDMSYTIEGQYKLQIDAIKEKSKKGVLQLGLDLSGGMNVVLEADLDSLKERMEEGQEVTAQDEADAITRAMEILNTRVDRFGLSEPSIRKLGENKIEIEIPGSSDSEIVETFLKGKGSLEFVIVNLEESNRINDYFQQNPGEIYDDNGEIKKPADLAAGLTIRPFYEKDSYGNDVFRQWYVVIDDQSLDGIHIKTAQPGSDNVTGKPVIFFTLDIEGGKLFAELTGSHLEEPMAVVLDGNIRSVATISSEISDSGRITGFNSKEAQDLSLILRTGAMPIELKVNSQQTVGASLGEDTIRQGLTAAIIGFSAVILFMLIWYLGAGFVADLALLLNVVFIIAILSAFQLTLTLTSIAGLILTVGMAVDANVIIFERIKEEYRLGKSAEASLKAGFKKAFWTIMDANVTTLIAAVFLSQLGTGPIQGFAYTLTVGIISSMFTALFVSRLMFDFSLETLRLKKISISWRLK